MESRQRICRSPSMALAAITVLMDACGGGGGSSAPMPPVTPPSVQVSVASNHASVTSGASVTLTWSSTNAQACTASGGWSGSKATSGSELVGPLAQTASFVLSCSGASNQSGSASVSVTVTAPTPGIAFVVSSDAVNDIVWDPRRGLIYLAIGSGGPVNPNTVLAFDPVAGTITKAVFAGSEPWRLAISDDGQYLYVGLAGADAIQRLILPQLALDVKITSDIDAMGPAVNGGEPLFAEQIAVAPGQPRTIGVARAAPSA
jgi:hypothetical protein